MPVDFVAKCHELGAICDNEAAAAAAGPRISQIMAIFIEGSCSEDDSGRFHCRCSSGGGGGSGDDSLSLNVFCRRTCCNVISVLILAKNVTLAQVMRPILHR